jgi:hypothetical protein
LDYTLKMNVHAGKLGAQYNALIAKYAGGKSDPNSEIPVTIGLGGKYDSPVPKLLMDDQKAQVKEAVTATVQEKGKEAIEKALAARKQEWHSFASGVQGVMGPAMV